MIVGMEYNALSIERESKIRIIKWQIITHESIDALMFVVRDTCMVWCNQSNPCETVIMPLRKKLDPTLLQCQEAASSLQPTKTKQFVTYYVWV